MMKSHTAIYLWPKSPFHFQIFHLFIIINIIWFVIFTYITRHNIGSLLIGKFRWQPVYTYVKRNIFYNLRINLSTKRIKIFYFTLSHTHTACARTNICTRANFLVFSIIYIAKNKQSNYFLCIYACWVIMKVLYWVFSYIICKKCKLLFQSTASFDTLVCIHLYRELNHSTIEKVFLIQWQ